MEACLMEDIRLMEDTRLTEEVHLQIKLVNYAIKDGFIAWIDLRVHYTHTIELMAYYFTFFVSFFSYLVSCRTLFVYFIYNLQKDLFLFVFNLDFYSNFVSNFTMYFFLF